MVSLGVSSDALQGVDASKPYRELFVTELLDCPGKPLRYLTFLGDLYGVFIKGYPPVCQVNAKQQDKPRDNLGNY